MRGSEVTVVGFAYHLHAMYTPPIPSFCLCLRLWSMWQQFTMTLCAFHTDSTDPNKAEGVLLLLQAVPLG